MMTELTHARDVVLGRLAACGEETPTEEIKLLVDTLYTIRCEISALEYDVKSAPVQSADTATRVDASTGVDKTYTQAEIRQMLIAARTEKNLVIPEFLKSLGYEKLSDVPESSYADLVRALDNV